MLFNKNKRLSLYAVCDGKSFPIKEMADEVFSSEMLGKGYYIEPESNYFYCPMQGKILKISDTGHAISISNEDGIEALVHIGIDTVELNGEGFKVEVGEGQNVNAGDIMAIVNIEFIKEKGYKASTAVVITNSEDIDKIKYNFGKVVAGKDDVMTFEKRKEK